LLRLLSVRVLAGRRLLGVRVLVGRRLLAGRRLALLRGDAELVLVVLKRRD
jgi:hypothetical protein